MKDTDLNKFLLIVNGVQISFDSSEIGKTDRPTIWYNDVVLSTSIDDFEKEFQRLRINAINEILENINQIDNSIAINYLTEQKKIIELCLIKTEKEEQFIIMGFPEELFASEYSKEIQDLEIAYQFYKKINTDLRSLYEIHNHNLSEFMRFINDTIQNKHVDDRLQKIIESNALPSVKSSHGFKCKLSISQIEKLFNKLKNEGFIDKKTNEVHFKAIFKDEILPLGFKPIKWIYVNRRKETHLTAFRELLTVALGKAPDQKTINACFMDENGKSIHLIKHKKEPNTESWTDTFKAMIS